MTYSTLATLQNMTVATVKFSTTGHETHLHEPTPQGLILVTRIGLMVESNKRYLLHCVAHLIWFKTKKFHDES